MIKKPQTNYKFKPLNELTKLGGILHHLLFLMNSFSIDRDSHFIDFLSFIPWIQFGPLKCFAISLLMNIFGGGFFERLGVEVPTQLGCQPSSLLDPSSFLLLKKKKKTSKNQVFYVRLNEEVSSIRVPNTPYALHVLY